MKAWSRAHHEGGRGGEYQPTEAELISSYLSANPPGGGVPYGVPIPPPLVPEDHDAHSPLPPPRSTSASHSHQSSSSGGGGRSRGKRSRHTGTSERREQQRDIHYPKYELYGQYAAKYSDQCQYNTKYGEDCHYKYDQQHQKQCDYNKTWPKQQCQDDPSVRYSQDDQNVHYIQELEESARILKEEGARVLQEESVKYAQIQKKKKDSQNLRQQVDKQVYHHDPRDRSPQPQDIRAHQQEIRAAQEERQAQEIAQQQRREQERPKSPPVPPPQPGKPEQPKEVSATESMEQSAHSTFHPPDQQRRSAEVQLQQENVQYVDGECCQVAVQPTGAGVVATSASEAADEVVAAVQAAHSAVQGAQQPMKKKKSAAYSQPGTLERRMATAERDVPMERSMSAANTLDRRRDFSCDTCDAPLTPASLAGIDHRDLEHRPLTRSVTRATMYDEPPEK